MSLSIAELYNPLPATLRATDPDGKFIFITLYYTLLRVYYTLFTQHFVIFLANLVILLICITNYNLLFMLMI